MSKQDDTLALMAQAHEDKRAQAAADKVVSLDKAKTWSNVTGQDVARFILQRMDELEALKTPEDLERKAELKGHEDELQILSDYFRRLDEARQEPGPKPPTYFFLTMAGDSVIVQYEDNGQECSYTFKDIFDYHRFVTDRSKKAKDKGLPIRVTASSSLDFPHEYTDQQEVVNLARAIRGNETPVA